MVLLLHREIYGLWRSQIASATFETCLKMLYQTWESNFALHRYDKNSNPTVLVFFNIEIC
jgi:hypothetical protein